MSQKSTNPLLEADHTGTGLVFTLRGDWDIYENPPGFEGIAPLLAEGSTARSATFQTGELGTFDSSLVSLLLQIHRRCDEVGITFDRDSLPEGVDQLLEMAMSAPENRDSHSGNREQHFIRRVGEASLHVIDELMDLFHFLGECILSAGRFLRGRARFQKRDLWIILQECGAEALPIVSLISGLVGMILGFVGAYQMADIGTVLFVANLVAIAMVREMGCLMTGIIMSGRTGAAFAAQIGSMKVNEEVDALKTFGFSPIDFLVLPRILALTIMMPLLTVYANFVGMIGGALVVCLSYDITFLQYLNQSVTAINLTDFFLGIGKSVIFGFIVAGAGCMRGLQSGSSATAVGTAATSAVVVSITAIVIADSIFAILTTLLDI